MTHSLLVTNPVIARLQNQQRKAYSLFQYDPLRNRWDRVTESSFEMNTARYVYCERIRAAYLKGKIQDIRPI